MPGTPGAAVVGRVPGEAPLHVPHHTYVPCNRHLKAAGIVKWTADGGADFHGLRHAFAMLLEQMRAGEKEQLVFARYAPRSLTFGRYIHAIPERLRKLVAGVGELVFSAQDCAYGEAPHGGLVGALMEPPWTISGCCMGGGGGQTGTRTRDPNKRKCDSSPTEPRQSPTRGALTGDRKARAPTVPRQGCDTSPRQKCAICVHAPELQALLDTWPNLPAAVRQRILKQVQQHQGGGDA